MAAIKPEIKAFMVQALACFDTPSQVVESVKNEFGIELNRQTVESHDPTKVAGKGLAQKWKELFEETRDRFKTEMGDIPIANRAFRLRALHRMAVQAESRKNYPLAAQLMEQAAKEVGESYTNKQILDHKSTDGTMSPAKAFTPEEYAHAKAKLSKELSDLD